METQTPLSAIQRQVLLYLYRTGNFPRRQGHLLSVFLRHGLVAAGEHGEVYLTEQGWDWTEAEERAASA